MRQNIKNIVFHQGCRPESTSMSVTTDCSCFSSTTEAFYLLQHLTVSLKDDHLLPPDHCHKTICKTLYDYMSYRSLSKAPFRSMTRFVTSELFNTLVLSALSTVTVAAVGTSLFRMALGRRKRTLATSLSHNNRLIIVFVSNKSEHNRLHVPVLF